MTAKRLTWTLEIAEHFKKPQNTSKRFSLNLERILSPFQCRWDEWDHPNGLCQGWGGSDGRWCLWTVRSVELHRVPRFDVIDQIIDNVDFNFVIVENLKILENFSVGMEAWNWVMSKQDQKRRVWSGSIRFRGFSLKYIWFRFESSVETAVWNKKTAKTAVTAVIDDH